MNRFALGTAYRPNSGARPERSGGSAQWRGWCTLAAGVLALGLGSAPAPVSAQVAHELRAERMTQGDREAMRARAIPMERRLETLPPGADLSTPLRVPRHRQTEGEVRVIEGSAPQHAMPGLRGPNADESGRAEPNGGVAPQNFGVNNLNTIYHYSDYRQDPLSYPYSAVGKFFLTASDGNTYWCSASMVSETLILTAGHCLHDGGNRNRGWIRSAEFVPAYADGDAPFGSCDVYWVIVTDGWFRSGQILEGYDVGMATCNGANLPDWAPPGAPLGWLTGWFGMCTGQCLQEYWMLTQVGYPGNYYSGDWMSTSQHLSHGWSNSVAPADYLSGSGMQGGSSGGPHVTNIGELQDSSSNPGQYPIRNVVLGVTSWGYVAESIKLQGASSLSGPGNSNDIGGIYNRICWFARQVNPEESCGRI